MLVILYVAMLQYAILSIPTLTSEVCLFPHQHISYYCFEGILIVFVKGRQPQYSFEWKTTSKKLVQLKTIDYKTIILSALCVTSLKGKVSFSYVAIF
jgi:hypothetical protein